jgi:GT2 family glycosyltransferase
MVIIRPMISSAESHLISIIIPNHNGTPCLEACLQSLQRQDYHATELLVVDNASEDESLEVIRRTAPQAVVLRQAQNLGFAGAVNAGLRLARGEWIAVLNNDTEVAADWLFECMAAAERHPDAGFLACHILDFHKRDSVYSAGDCFLRAGIGYRRGQELADSEDYQQDREIFSACGCAALYRREIFEKAGGYEDRFFAYLEDIDLGLRLQASGCRGYYVSRARVYHLGGMTSGGEFSPLAVRLRTRNALLLLLKSLPLRFLFRCAPMIMAAQLVWLARVFARARFWSYLRGLGEAVVLAPPMLSKRTQLRPFWRRDSDRLWQAILESESLARKDFSGKAGQSVSTFLKWYFRVW